MNAKRPLVLHPFLLAAYLVLALLAFNLDQAAMVEAIRPLFILIVLTAAGLFLWHWIVSDWQRAGIIVSLHLLLFFGYGHIFNQTGTMKIFSPISEINRHLFLTAIVVSLFILLTWALWRLVRRPLPSLTVFLNTVFIVALIAPVWQISLRFIDRVSASFKQESTSEKTAQPSPPEKNPPDIYYIILDAYTRDDILLELFEYDNSSFSNALVERSFQIIPRSHSNYAQTGLSLASSLNYQYLDDLPTKLDIESEDRHPLGELIRDSHLRQTLEAHGYTTVAIASGYNLTDFQDADVYLQNGRLQEFEMILLRTTWIGSYYDAQLNFEAKRQRVNFTFDALGKGADITGPKFVFAHILAPHTPNVFGPNGERITPSDDPLSRFDTDDGISIDLFSRFYTDEITYLNSRILEVIDNILAYSETQPIIIIQGDHGPEAFLDLFSAENTCMRSRLSIFNAILLPEEARSQLYADMTPVNTFPIVLNLLFNSDLPRQPDKSFFSLWQRPYDFISLTEADLAKPCSSVP